MPDDAAILVDFLNTVDIDEEVDLLSDDTKYEEWARARGLRPTKRVATRKLRDALRQLVVDGVAELPRVALSVSVGTDRLPRIAGDDVASRVLAAVIGLVERGEWERIKLCPNPVCLEAFYDRSKNRCRAWCDMSGCGSAAKARAYRARRRERDEQ